MRQWLGSDLEWSDRQLEASLDIADVNIRNMLFRLAWELRHPGLASDRLIELITAQLAIDLARYLIQFNEIPDAGKLAPWRLRLIDDRLREVQEIPIG